MLGFPGGAVVESPLADAGDVGSGPGLGGSHMPRSGWAHEPWPLHLHVRSLCSATGEATTVRGPRIEKKVCVCSALEDIAKHFAKVVVPIYTPSSSI